MLIPYSGKFSLVHNFVELPPSSTEENFVVLNFALALWQDHTHQQSIISTRKICGSYFRGSQSIRENREILHHAKISRYMVVVYHETQNNHVIVLSC